MDSYRPATRAGAASAQKQRERTHQSACAAGRLDHFRPLRHFGLDVGAELLGCAGRGIETLIEQEVLDVGHGEHLGDFGVQALDDRSRRFRRHEHTVPVVGVEAGQAGFGDGRQFRHQRRALDGSHRNALDLAGLDLRHRACRGREHQLHLAADEIDHRRSAALVRDVHHLGAGHDVEQFAGEMARCRRRRTNRS